MMNSVPSRDQRLSELVDDELSRREIGPTLDSLAEDVNLQNRWARYHLLRDCVQNHMPETVDPAFAQNVMARVAHETTDAEGRGRRRQGGLGRLVDNTWRPLAGGGVAAAVALVAILVALSGPQGTPGDGISGQARMADNSGLETVGTARPDGTAEVHDAESSRDPWERASPRLNGYLVNHAQFSSRSGMQGALPYARATGYGEYRAPAR